MVQVERALLKFHDVQNTMIILLVVEGCCLFLSAAVYVCLLVRKVRASGAALTGVALHGFRDISILPLSCTAARTFES